jgi:GWxTD domain-containing protein
MRSTSTLSVLGGHPWDGPRCFRAFALPLAAAALTATAACGGASGPERPTPSQTQPFARPLEIYRELGFMAGPGQFPAVASFSTIAGPADSTYLLLALSIPNSALRFQREGTGFQADYDVAISIMLADSVPVRRAQGRESVRIPSFGETARTDESIVHQQGWAVPPGRYIVRLEATDANSSRGFRMTDTLMVPSYAAGGARLSSPVVVYEAAGRARTDQLPSLITNPRHTVPHGGDAPRIYVESYDPAAVAVAVRVLDSENAVVWSGTAPLVDAGVRHAVVEIPAASLPLGRFVVEVDDGTGSARADATVRAPLVMAISDQWMVANFDDVLQFLRYIAEPAELDSLRSAPASERSAAWERFWTRRDPLPVTPVNEYRDEFFQRVRYATEAFRETGGRDGWATDRGEVYIVLGPPSAVRERTIGDATGLTGRPNGEEWTYHSVPGGALTLTFQDRTGFGRYELLPASAAAFRNVAERLRRGPTATP